MRRNLIVILITCSLCLIGSIRIFSQTLPRFVVKTNLTFITTNDSALMETAAQVFENVMNDTAFQAKLQETRFSFDRPNDPMRTLTTAKIVDTLFSGREWYTSKADNTADIYWECTKRPIKPPFSSTIGYGNESDKFINTYLFYLRGAEMKEIVNNLAHEWSHKIGFDHQQKDHSERGSTVPYLFGDIVESFSKKYIIVVSEK